MPRSVDEGFRDFLAKLTASETETAAAKSHRASIEARLETDFTLLRFFRIGSFGNGTSISNFSDVDYLASLSTGFYGSTSGYALTKVRNSLAGRFPNTGVHVDCPAVVVPFGSYRWESHEIVPGDFVDKQNGFHVYRIPDCADGWMRASPEAHIAFVNSVNEKLNYKVKPLIRFIKAWKYFKSVPISSFYLEMRIAKYASAEPSIIYYWDIDRVLTWLWENQLPSIQDPMGISGYIPACKTSIMRSDALSKVETAAKRAANAHAALKKENIADAFYWWRLLYDDQFPTYYY